MDLNILRWIDFTFHSNTFMNEIWKFITSTCDVACIWVVLCCVLVNFKSTKKIALIMALSMGINCLIVEVGLKNIFMRTRPFAIENDFLVFLESIGYPPPYSSSFPSGHASTSIAVAMTLFLYNKKWGTPAVIWAFLVALSRAYLCVHFPSDIIAGLMIGIIVANLVYTYSIAFIDKYNKHMYGIIKLTPMLTGEDFKNHKQHLKKSSCKTL